MSPARDSGGRFIAGIGGGGGGKLAEAFVQVRTDQKTLRRDLKNVRGLFTRTVDSIARRARSVLISPFAGLLGTAAAIGTAKKLIALATEQEQAERKLAAVLKATGNAAGFSAKQLISLADELQNTTAFADDATINMMAVLATFRNISGPVFTDAVKAVQDMSAVLGQDLQQGAIQLGKALNDPIVGFTALQRVGVSFTTQQKEMIKTLFKAGDMMGAQKVILEELKGEFGGAARAMATTVSGQFKNFINRMGDIGEKIGHTLIQYLLPLTEQMEKLAKWFEINHRWILVSIKEWGVFALKAGAVVLGIRAIIKIAKVLVATYKALAGSQIILTALQGPKGWAVLAGAVAATAVTAKLLREEFNDIAGAIGRAADEAERLSGATQKGKEKTVGGKSAGETFKFATAKREQIREIEAQITALNRRTAERGPHFGDPTGEGGKLRRRLKLAQETLARLEAQGQKQFEAESKTEFQRRQDVKFAPDKERRDLIGAGFAAMQEKREKQRAARLGALGAQLFRAREAAVDLVSGLSGKKGMQLAGIGVTELGGALGSLVGRGVGVGRAAGRGGLAGLGLAAKAARPGAAAPETVGRGGFTGIADLSRQLQMGIFGSRADKLQSQQEKHLAKIAASNEASKKALEQLVQEGMGVFGLGAE